MIHILEEITSPTSTIKKLKNAQLKFAQRSLKTLNALLLPNKNAWRCSKQTPSRSLLSQARSLMENVSLATEVEI
jgi:hypothetical protein